MDWYKKKEGREFASHEVCPTAFSPQHNREHSSAYLGQDLLLLQRMCVQMAWSCV